MDIFAVVKAKHEKLKIPPNLRRCEDCCGWPSDYMVHDHVWLSVMPSLSGLLCLYCLEVRLKRRLVLNDFIDAIVNHEIFFGYHMEQQTYG